MASDKLVDFDHVKDFISREEASEVLCLALEDDWEPEYAVDRMREIPAADVVARDCYDRILAENDTMREQLAQIGKKPGDSMDDVRPIIKGRWLWDRGTRTCIVCGQMKATDKKDSFCSCCGADNREVTTE